MVVGLRYTDVVSDWPIRVKKTDGRGSQRELVYLDPFLLTTQTSAGYLGLSTPPRVHPVGRRDLLI